MGLLHTLALPSQGSQKQSGASKVSGPRGDIRGAVGKGREAVEKSGVFGGESLRSGGEGEHAATNTGIGGVDTLARQRPISDGGTPCSPHGDRVSVRAEEDQVRSHCSFP